MLIAQLILTELQELQLMCIETVLTECGELDIELVVAEIEVF